MAARRARSAAISASSSRMYRLPLRLPELGRKQGPERRYQSERAVEQDVMIGVRYLDMDRARGRGLAQVRVDMGIDQARPLAAQHCQRQPQRAQSLAEAIVIDLQRSHRIAAPHPAGPAASLYPSQRTAPDELEHPGRAILRRRQPEAQHCFREAGVKPMLARAAMSARPTRCREIEIDQGSGAEAGGI